MCNVTELEAYSQVISTFRAQGSLDEKKLKILKELREIFHINEDRHRAEIRRASNDEELCTIAEKYFSSDLKNWIELIPYFTIYRVAGPNTGQEWCIEGRRRYPLLPRVPLDTAFSFIADSATKDVVSEAQISDNLKEENRKDLPISSIPVVTEDPFSIVNAKKADIQFSKSPKKRSIEKDLATPPLHTNMRIQQIYNSHSVGGRIPTKQRKIQSKRPLSIKGKLPGEIIC